MRCRWYWDSLLYWLRISNLSPAYKNFRRRARKYGYKEVHK